jgi:methionyl-tRNA synthetase
MTFYVTTPIYYVNDAPHIGHAYTTTLADVLNRYHRLFGDDTYFLTGTDEHGQKVQSTARDRGIEPQAHCDEYVEHFKDIWKELDINYDFFIRTTDAFHKKGVSDCLQALWDKGLIYENEYEGWYSVSEEMFYSEDELIDGKSPMGKEVVKLSEKNYFFKMSQYQERLVQHINDNPTFIQPEGKKNEVLGFLRAPLGDLCISRPKSRLAWGVELPFDSDYVTYVWFDALLNYCTAVGLHQDDEKAELFDRYWKHATHLIGKDILITHSVYWPTMLMALDVPLPKQIFAHGWWLTEDDRKMSKSEGPVVKPLDMKDIVGVDGFRYYLMRGMNPASDGRFSRELVATRVNADLANNLGNLFSRAVGLIVKYLEAKIPAPTETPSEEAAKLAESAVRVAKEVRQDIEVIAPQRAIERITELFNETNRYLDTVQPWKLLKNGTIPEAAESLYCALEVLRISAILLSPVMPNKMDSLLHSLGWTEKPKYDDTQKWGLLASGTEVSKPAALFPRVEEEQSSAN